MFVLNCGFSLFFFLFFFTFSGLKILQKKGFIIINIHSPRGRGEQQQVGDHLCLFVQLCYHLLFPVKTGNDRGENGA